jgi:hypothetical protein
MQGTIVQVNISPGGLPKRAIAEGGSRPSASRATCTRTQAFTAGR